VTQEFEPLRKSPETDCPASFGNAANHAGFPLCHGLGGWLINLNWTFHSVKSGHFIFFWAYLPR